MFLLDHARVISPRAGSHPCIRSVVTILISVSTAVHSLHPRCSYTASSFTSALCANHTALRVETTTELGLGLEAMSMSAAALIGVDRLTQLHQVSALHSLHHVTRSSPFVC